METDSVQSRVEEYRKNRRAMIAITLGILGIIAAEHIYIWSTGGSHLQPVDIFGLFTFFTYTRAAEMSGRIKEATGRPICE